MGPRSSCLVLGIVPAAFLYGQSLHVPPSETGRTKPGSFSVILESPPGRAPVAIQWEFVVPAAIDVKTEDIRIGTAAQAATKKLTCAKKPGSETAVRYICILAGGQSPIGHGPIAVVQYRAQADVQGAPIRVAIENVLGASADLQRIPMSNAMALLRIH